MNDLVQASAKRRTRLRAALAALLTPRAALAHGGGFELILPAWFLGGFLLLWGVAGWNARARLKWITTLIVLLSAWVGGVIANRVSDRSWPADVAENWILGTVVGPLLVFATIRIAASRSKPHPTPKS
jgi:cytochrome c oxidase assembly factor CtaG